MNREKMFQARELIQQKRYDEAKALLQTVDHPTAQKWLTQIDRIQAAQNKPEKERPGTVGRLWSMWRTGSRAVRGCMVATGLVTLCVCCSLFAVAADELGMFPATGTPMPSAVSMADDLSPTVKATATPDATNTVPDVMETDTEEPLVATHTAEPTHEQRITAPPLPPPTHTPTLFESNLLDVVGVQAVRASNVQSLSGGGYLVYLEIDTQAGYNTLTTAQLLYQAACTALIAQQGSSNVSPVEFSSILWDGQSSSSDYRWDHRNEEWHITELSIMPDAALDAADSPTSEPVTWYVIGAERVNIRSCASMDCEILTTAGYSDTIQVLDTQNDWHQVQLDGGRVGYIAVWLTSRTRPTARQLAATQPPAQQSTQPPPPPAQPTSPPQPTALPTAGYTCNCSRLCSQITSCAEAYFQLIDCGCNERDGNGDGVPCENLCQ